MTFANHTVAALGLTALGIALVSMLVIFAIFLAILLGILVMDKLFWRRP